MLEGLGYTSVAISYICFKNEILLIMIIIKEIAALFDFVPCCYTFQMVLLIRGRASWSRRSVWYTPRRRSGVFFSSSFLLHDICFNCSENAVHIGGFYFMRLRTACYTVIHCLGEDLASFSPRRFYCTTFALIVVRMQCISVDFTSCGFVQLATL